MAVVREVKAMKTFMGKLAHGADLLEEITRICVDRDIHLGRVEALGAVKKARLGITIKKNVNIISMNLIKRLRLQI